MMFAAIYAAVVLAPVGGCSPAPNVDASIGNGSNTAQHRPTEYE